MNKSLFLVSLVLHISMYSQVESLENLSQDLDLQNQDTAKVNTSIKIIKLLNNSKDYSNALKFAEESESLSSALNYTAGLAKINQLKGDIYFQKKENNRSLKFYKAAKDLYIKLNNTIEIANVNANIAFLKIEQGENDMALKYALTAIKSFQKNKNYSRLNQVYDQLIEGFQTKGVNDKAIVFCLEKLKILESQQDTQGLISLNKQLALLYDKEGNNTKAISYLKSSLDLGGHDEKLQADLFPILGGLLSKKGAYRTATNYLKEGLKLNRKIKNKQGIITSLSHLGTINLKYKNFKSAEKQFVEIESLAKETENNTALLINYKNRMALDSIRGDFKNAFHHQTQYYSLLNRNLAKYATEKDNAIATQVNSIRDEKDGINQANSDALLLTKVNKNATVVSKNKFDRFRKTLYLSLAGFSILAICLIIAYFKRNKGLKYTRDLELKNKNIELQKKAILEESKHFEDINKTKDKLFSIVSHDLKDSLTSTKGLIDLLKEGSITKEEFNALIPELSETANNASSLLFNLLNWSKSQMKSLKSKPTTFDIKSVFEEKIKLVEQKLIAKNITLVNESSNNYVFADRAMVEIVVQNIMANAIKFCNSLDKIKITDTTKNNHLIIGISDTGVGISKDNINKLFGGDKNYTTKGTHNEKGTGLGLSICKDLIELNNGRIWVESTLGVGSTFFIELPMSKEQPQFSKPASASVEILRPSYTAHSHLHKLQ